MAPQLPYLNSTSSMSAGPDDIPRRSRASTLGGSEWSMDLEEPTADGSRWSKRSQTTLQKITDLCSDSLANADLVSVRRLNVMQLKNHKAQQHLKRRSVMASARLVGAAAVGPSNSRMSVASEGSTAFWTNVAEPPPEDVAKRAVDVVKLLTVWDKYTRPREASGGASRGSQQPQTPDDGPTASGYSATSASALSAAASQQCPRSWPTLVSISTSIQALAAGAPNSPRHGSHAMVDLDLLAQLSERSGDIVPVPFHPQCPSIGGMDASQAEGPAGDVLAEELHRALDSMASIREVRWEEEAAAAAAAGALRAGAIADRQQEYAGGFGSTQRLCERLRVMEHLVTLANPAGFDLEAAAVEVADFKDASDRARTLLRKLELPNAVGVAQLRGLVQELHYCRPFFSPPELPKKASAQRAKPLDDESPPLTGAAGGSGGGGAVAWDVSRSLFRPRRIESDAQDLFDTHNVRERQLQHDWRRVSATASLRDLVAQADAGVREGRDTLESLLTTLHAHLVEHQELVATTFLFYSLSGRGTGHAAFSMGEDDWVTFLTDCALVDERCTLALCHDIYELASSGDFAPLSPAPPSAGGLHGEGGGIMFTPRAAHGDAAVSSTAGRLLRFQFVNALLRLAVAKFIYSSAAAPKGVCAALTCLFVERMLPRLPDEARHDANKFRRTRMYTQLVVEQLDQNLLLLLALYNLHTAKTRSKHLGLDGWVAFLQSVELLGTHTGIGPKEARLLFGWSQMTVVDEVGRRARSVSITFVDFLEALCRLADTISPPPLSDMRRALREALHLADDAAAAAVLQSAWPYHALYGKMGRVDGKGNTTPMTRRPSCGLLTKKTRLLYMKVDALMNCVKGALHQAWCTGGDIDQLVHKLTAMAKAMAF